MLVALIVADLLMIGSFVLRYSTLPPQIPLFYSKSWGEDQLVDLWFIFLLPIVLNILYFLNLFFYHKVFAGNILFLKIINYLNLGLVILFTFTFLRIIFLVS